MSEFGLLYTLSELGASAMSFFIWVFSFFQEPIPILNNTPIMTLAFSGVMAIFFLKPLVDDLLGGIIPGD